MSLTDVDGPTLQRLAYEAAPIEPKGMALVFIVVVSILFAVCTFILALRVYVRGWMMRQTRGWAWDDTFAVLAYGAFLCSGIFGIRAAFYGLGTHDADLPNPVLMIRAAEYMLFANILYGFSMPLVKAAVLFTMLPITTETKYRWILYALQAISTIMSIIGVLASLLYCRPVPAYWNPLLGSCGDFMVVVNIGYAWTTIGIVTDIGFAAVPFFVVRKLQMTPRTKRTVTVILCFGVVACIATIVRAPYLQYYLVETDRLYWNGHITLWCLLETGLAMIATNLPPLRLLFLNYLKSKSENSYGSKTGSGGRSNHVPQSHALVTIGGGGRPGADSSKMRPSNTSHSDLEAGREAWDNYSDNSSSKAIVQQTTIQVTSEERKQG